MVLTLAVIGVVSAALLAGAAWGLWGQVKERTEGFLIALAGGAMLISVVGEMIEPSIARSSIWTAMAGVAVGAVSFTALDYWADRRWGTQSGGGLLAAITIDGVPESLALGVSLIGAGLSEVTALAASIMLANVPEAAGGARQMAQSGMARSRVLATWSAAAALLAASALAGNLLLEGASEDVLALIRCSAAGAVVASLATAVFPQAYREDRNLAGIATAMGVIVALLIGSFGG